ncbi:sirohydrochlorin chelatase [Paractinoplanes ferrugineus]|uniref:Cobalamin biosynthesis protein n=1 Tax=Paractinoplanes ferrugineus TaxID=113564 RepID=A0A919MBV0_9ACTN|nr:CbiX/SirB N-terminal domain-containing protein [Actinoplanes ferrugineus]GIE08809.1 cobalamin biosynthesis protein [Actinoplanes ferrugineus]
MRPARLTVVLVAHGSRDPRAAAATEALTRAVGRAQPSWDVRAAYLDHAGPRPLDVLAGLAPGSRAVLVPLLLTKAYHGRIDIPAVVEAAVDLPVSVTLAEVLGPQPGPLPPGSAPVPAALLDGLVQRLPAGRFDAVVLAAAGTRNSAARVTVEWVADALSARLGLPCAVAYASAAPPLPGAAVDLLRASGAQRVAMAAYFLAPGFLYDLAADSARSAGAVAIAEPLTDAPDLVSLVTARVAEVAARPAAAA